MWKKSMEEKNLEIKNIKQKSKFSIKEKQNWNQQMPKKPDIYIHHWDTSRWTGIAGLLIEKILEKFWAR